MNILIIILVIIAALLVILFVAAALSSHTYRIERNVIINKPKATVFDYIRLLRNQSNYNKWVMLDPAMKKEYQGTDGTPGFVYSWDSENKNVGKGEQEIKSITEGEKIDYEIRFIKPFEGIAQASMLTETVSPDQTRVTWIFRGTRTYMLKVMHIVLNLPKVLGRDLQTSLDRLKALLEQQ